ncbi:MAG: LCP family protein [Clostridia bacterium]|nr:LCP family protein [Clostridia bacterium]
MKKRTYIRVIIFVLCFAVIFASLIIGIGLVEKIINKSDGFNTDDDYAYFGDEISFEGKKYIPKKYIETYLVLGIDNKEHSGSAQSDFIALLVIDKATEAVDILQINRDTMTEIRKLSNDGKVTDSFVGQLALAYAYGAGGKNACRNSVAAVENLLYGINVDHYISLTMSAVSEINDSVGGVTVSLLDDFTHVNESWAKGTTVTLKGDEALTYIRERGALEDSSNISRMERQRQYMSALFDKYGKADTDASVDLVSVISEHLISDCTVDQLSKLVERLESYSNNGIYSIEGTVENNVHQNVEFYPDEIAMKRKVIELFYSPVESDSNA